MLISRRSSLIQLTSSAVLASLPMAAPALSSVAYLEDFGGSGGRGADPNANTRAFATALQAGAMVRLRDHGTYPIARAISMNNRSSITGSGGAAAPEIVMPDTAFGRECARAYYDSNIGIKVWGDPRDLSRPITDVHLEGFRFVSQGSDKRLFHAICARNALRLRLRGIQFGPFNGAAIGVKYDSCFDIDFEDLIFHDFMCNAGLKEDGSKVMPAGVNITCIWSDDDIVTHSDAGVSKGGRMVNIRIRDINVGPEFYQRYGGDQTDGLTGGGHNTFLSGFDVKNVGEPWDTGGIQGVTMDGFRFENGRNFGLKMPYGPNRNIIKNGQIINPSRNGIASFYNNHAPSPNLAAIAMSGSHNPTVLSDNWGNTLSRIEIQGCGSFGVKIADAGLRQVRDNKLDSIRIFATPVTTHLIADTNPPLRSGGPNLFTNIIPLGDLSGLTSVFQSNAPGNSWCKFAGGNQWFKGTVTRQQLASASHLT